LLQSPLRDGAHLLRQAEKTGRIGQHDATARGLRVDPYGAAEGADAGDTASAMGDTHVKIDASKSSQAPFRSGRVGRPPQLARRQSDPPGQLFFREAMSSREISPIGCEGEAARPRPFVGIQYRFPYGRAARIQRLGRESPRDDLGPPFATVASTMRVV
jgi:hypothetical protein